MEFINELDSDDEERRNFRGSYDLIYWGFV